MNCFRPKLISMAMFMILISMMTTGVAFCFQLPIEVTSTIKDRKAIRMLQKNPKLTKDIRILFEDPAFVKTIKGLEPFQQRIMVKKASISRHFRRALKADYRRALPAAGLASTSSSFTSQLITAHKKGKVKVGKDGKVQGFKCGKPKKSQA